MKKLCWKWNAELDDVLLNAIEIKMPMVQQHGQISKMWEEVADLVHSGCKSSTAIDHWKVLEKQFHHGEAA